MNKLEQLQRELVERIRGTNNGYLFAPTAKEVYVAMQYGYIFNVQFDPDADDFPLRISLA
jgi:hypothetical protein